MHRDDKAFADQIELAFLAKGLRPEQGIYLNENRQSACAMGALGAHNIFEASRMLNIEPSMCEALEQGFDCYGHDADDVFAYVLEGRDRQNADRASRLFRIGYSVAKRMFSKAPAEVVPVRELVLS